MPYRKADFTADFATALLEQHGTVEDAAKAIAPECIGHHGHPLNWRSVKSWISEHAGPRRIAREAARAANRGMGVDMSRPDDAERINRIDDLLARANVPIDAIGAIRSTTLKAYGAFHKGVDADGKPIAVKVPLYSTTINITPPNPEFPVIHPAPTTTIAFIAPPRILRRTRSIPIISDIQAGWLRDTRTDTLEPIHDPLAIDVAQQIVADVAPSEIVFIGDVADLAMFSRWQQYQEYRGVLQQSVNVTHEILGGFVSAAGARCTKRTIVGSNHDHRIEKGVLEWNREALGVRRAGVVDGWPVFSLGYLARFDDLGLEWSGQFPGGEFYILEDLVAMHAPPKSKEFQASVVHGHTHKVQRTPFVQHARRGRQVHYVADVGCLCRTGVTDDKFRLMVTNTPSDRGRTDWVAGIAVVNIVDDPIGPIHAIDLIEIMSPSPDARVAIMGGQHYRSRGAVPQEAA